MQRLSDLWARISFEISKFRWGQTHLRQYLLWTLAPVLLLLFYQIVFRRPRRRRKRKFGSNAPGSWPGLDSEFYDLEEKLAALGLARASSEPLGEWLERVDREATFAPLRAPLQQAFELHYRYRFDPHGLNSAQRAQLRSAVDECLETLEQAAEAAERQPALR
jgi:hypothetical protein